MDLAELLRIPRGITALLGGGGKTTLLYALAEELGKQGPVLVCTSTHIRVPEHMPLYTGRDPAELTRLLRRHGVVCAGLPAEEPGKLCDPALPFSALSALADHVLVEADGARGLPLKAHADHEPVLPENAARTVLVLGADGFGRPIREVCHRPDLYAARAEADPADPVTPILAARVIRREGFGDMVFINKLEDAGQRTAARTLAAALDRPAAGGSLHRGEWECLS